MATNLFKNQVLEYKNDGVIKKYARDYELPLHVANDHFIELKKFLYVCATYKGAFSPTQTIDNVWHTFILFTKDYHSFCIEYFGKFIHHTPDVEINEETKKQNNISYRLLYDILANEFGKPISKTWYNPYEKLKMGSLVSNGECTGDGGDGNCSGGQGDCGGHSCSPDSSCNGDDN